jgi:hypothetical protein
MQVWRVQVAWVAHGDRYEAGGEFAVKPPYVGWQQAVGVALVRHGIETKDLIEVSACLLAPSVGWDDELGELDNAEADQKTSAADTEPPRTM